MQRLRIIAALARPTLRAIRRGPVLATMGAGMAIVAVPALMPVTLSADDLSMLLRLASVCAGVGLAFLLDDPAKPSVTTVAAPAWLGVVIRALTGLVAGAVWWAAAVVVTVTGASDGIGHAVRIGGLSVEAATIAALAFALASIGWRRARDGIASTLAAPAILLAVTALALVPERFALVVDGIDPRWKAAHWRMSVLLAASLAVTLVMVRPPISRYGRRHGV